MDLIDYMKAHLRLHAVNSNLNSWTNDEIIQSFIALTPPKVSFQEWIDSISYLYKELGEEPKEEPTKEDKSLANMDPYEKLIRFHRPLINQGIVRIEEHRNDEAEAESA